MWQNSKILPQSLANTHKAILAINMKTVFATVIFGTLGNALSKVTTNTAGGK